MELSTSSLTAASIGAILRDKTVPGLHARVTATGRKFYLYFRTKGGVERRPKIGEHPLMTVAQARAIAKDMLLDVAKGNDPMAERQAYKLAATVSELIDEYAAKHGARRKTGEEMVRSLKKALLPKLEHRKVCDVTHNDLAAIHHALAHKPYQANRVIAYASKMFALAELWGMRPKDSNPCEGIERYPEKKRRRYMAPEEARKVADELDKRAEADPASVAFIYLLILTGARKGEIAAARWTWIDGNVLHLPDSKTGAKDIFLPPPAMDVLARLPVTAGTITGIKNPKKLWISVRTAAGCPDLRLHDLRHSFASAALDQGLSLAQIGELLGHASTQTTKRYAHLVESTAHAAAARTASAVLADMRGKPCTIQPTPLAS